jgi:hypothetical protein
MKYFLLVSFFCVFFFVSVTCYTHRGMLSMPRERGVKLGSGYYLSGPRPAFAGTSMKVIIY